MNKFKLLIALFLPLFALTACQMETKETDDETEDETETTVGMLQHVVYFYLNEEVTEEEKAAFENGLAELLSIDEVYFYEIGIPGSTAERDVTDHSFAYSISAWFLTMEDYEIYADHPIHMEFIDEYEDLWADVKVYDSEIIAEK